MVFEYVIINDCVPQSHYGLEEFIKLRKQAAKAHTYAQDFMKEEIKSDMDAEFVGIRGFVDFDSIDHQRYYNRTVTVSTYINGEITRQEVPYGEVAQSIEHMKQIRGHCDNCPVNVDKRTSGHSMPGGCWGSIQYPFTRWADTFLDWIVRYQLDNFHQIDGLYQSFLNTLTDQLWLGPKIAEMRSQGEWFFEDPQTKHYSLTKEGQAIHFTLDHVWGMLLEYPDKTISDEMVIDYYQYLILPFFHQMENLLPQAPPEVLNGFKTDKTIAQLRLLGKALVLASKAKKRIITIP